MKLLLRIGLFLALVAGLAFVKFKYFPQDAALKSDAPRGVAGSNAPTMGIFAA